MVKDKKYTLYNFGLYAILFVVLSAILVALLRLFQVGVSVSYIIKISLPKIITGIKLMIAPLLAFLGAMITDPQGYSVYCDRLERYNKEIDEQLGALTEELPGGTKYKNTELLEYMEHKDVLFYFISYSLTLLSSIIILSTAFNVQNVSIEQDMFIVYIAIALAGSVALFVPKRLASNVFYRQLKI